MKNSYVKTNMENTINQSISKIEFEIKNQPLEWNKNISILFNLKSKFIDFFKTFDIESKVIYVSGVGALEYAASIVVNQIRTYGYNAIALSPADFVTDPHSFINASKKYCLVSLIENEDSIETVATSIFFKKLNVDLVQAVITTPGLKITNKLSKDIDLLFELVDNSLSFLTTNFTTLLIVTIIIFVIGKNEPLLNTRTESFIQKDVPKIIGMLEKAIANIHYSANYSFSRYIVLGSNVNRDFANFSASNFMKFCKGKITTHSDSPLSFRRIQADLINKSTFLVIIRSDGNYVRRLEGDLILELKTNYPNVNFLEIDFNGNTNLINGLFATVYLQLLTLFKSVQLEIFQDDKNEKSSVDPYNGIFFTNFN